EHPELDAVVYEFDEMTAAGRTDVEQATGDREQVEIGFGDLEAIFFATDHETGSLARAWRSPTSTRIEAVDALIPRAPLAPDRVAPEGGCAVHHDVALDEMIEKGVELVVHERAGG